LVRHAAAVQSNRLVVAGQSGKIDLQSMNVHPTRRRAGIWVIDATEIADKKKSQETTIKWMRVF